MFEIWQVTFSAVTITAFVAMMMLIIEYLNVTTEGLLIKTLTGGNKFKGYFLGALLGATPGCLGAFAMVSLYSHRRVTIGAIVATMISTSGDEAFVMLGLFPKTAIFLFLALALLGIIAGWLTDTVFLKNHPGSSLECCNFQHHPHQEQTTFKLSSIKNKLKHSSPIRGILTVTLTIFLGLMFAFKLGIIEHPDDHMERNKSSVHDEHQSDINNDKQSHHEEHSANSDEHAEHSHGTGGWTWYTLVIMLFFGIFIISTVSDHFLEEHLWEHVFKSHIPRIFIWTLGAMSFMAIMNHFLDINDLIAGNLWIILLIAVAIGLIPESGPHLVFVTLFAQGHIPLAILVASSIVQDGHGMVPLLAHSRKDFLQVKAVNAAIGLAIGATMLALNF
ncbi:MAG: arsenic efflux protein [Deltaproteobacteria bacterium]|nr:arsenic efflux protein [Deltaproteobacteria bacterium]